MTEEQRMAIAAAVAAVAVGLPLLWLLLRSRRRVRDRVHLAASRLAPVPVDTDRSTERILATLEHSVDEAVRRMGDAAASEARMAQALAAIGDGIVLLGDDGRTVFRNRQADRFLEARHGEALVESAIDELAMRALNGERSDQTVDIFGPPRRTVVVSASPLDDGHRHVGALVVIEDITERRRIDAVRRDFVANISHELKTPVGGLGVLAETIVDEHDPEVVSRLARRMHTEAMRASRTIDDLLELSRIEAGEPGTREPVPVHLVLAAAVERAAGAAENRGIAIDLREPPRRLELLGDRRQLVSAVFNLLDNAIKYSQPGSSVVVHADADGSVVRLSVADTGMGIPRRDLDRIFERFYRVDRARSRETGGTGLGLAIVRHVATNHGGEIEVTSREGEGSTFSLALPAGPGPVVVTAASDPPSRAG